MRTLVLALLLLTVGCQSFTATPSRKLARRDDDPMLTNAEQQRRIRAVALPSKEQTAADPFTTLSRDR